MTNTNVSPRFDGSVELTAADVERLPYVSLLPGDFTDRLERLKEASGLSWSGFAKAIGIDYKQMYRWHNDGVEPSGGRLPLPRPVRKQDTRRTAHPLRRGVSDDLLQGLTGSPRPRRRSGGA